ncbi:MAG: hypothetical protein ACLFTK_09360, partial [Anaerolineales bacterium]
MRQTRILIWAMAAFVLVIGLLGGGSTPPTVQAASFTVTESDGADWWMSIFGTAPGTYGFATPTYGGSTGVGAFVTEITSGGQKVILGRINYHNVPLSNLTSITYDTYYDSVSGSMGTIRQFYVNIYVDRDGDGIYDERLDFAPEVHSGVAVMADTWQTWTIDGTTEVNGNVSGLTTLDAYRTAWPNAQLNAFSNVFDQAIRFNMGDTAATYDGFAGAIDNIVLNIGGVTDTYDFEPTPTGGPVENINTGIRYATIQDAINASQTLNGHTLRADPGT